MSSEQSARSQTRRPPLGEATRRVINSQQSQKSQQQLPLLPSKSSPAPHHESLRKHVPLQVYKPTSPSPMTREGYGRPQEELRPESPRSNVTNPGHSVVSKEHPATNSNRNSQISTVSTNASDNIKRYIGPWKLGKTLGKGATARVRLARHAMTSQEAAIKIVQKKDAQMSQAGSLADLDRAEARMLDRGDGLRRMPIGIEREVAIMKLIQHPNIMKLYDIWENRTEIYLVLEYVDNGELFEHITASGRLGEEEALRYFRQILSAVGYCHSFNICHRDLKPENILLNRQGEIKIADFGMAALHQGPDHRLQTSCGSPHYAAPELIRGSTYRGEKVDIWSMGVILYATLCGRLPFDVDSSAKDWLGSLLTKIKRGSYVMAPEFTSEAADLIWRILQVNPRDRINLNHIWRHPLLRKYDYLDNYGGGCNPQLLNIKDVGRPILRESDIDPELLRHLRSLWHTMGEKELVQKLMGEQPNDQKKFYGLLVKYREDQLENYAPDVVYSTSDYHHAKPLPLTKTYSTCHFPRPDSKGHARQGSRFTVISNAAETVQSYDPFKASRPQYLDALRASDRAKITIHRVEDAIVQPRKASRTSTSRSLINERHGQERLVPPHGSYASRSSLASSTRSRNSGMRASSRHKRGVSFTHIRKQAINNKRTTSADTQLEFGQERCNSVAGDTLHPTASIASSTHYISSRKAQATTSQLPRPADKPGRGSHVWNEDVQQLSSSLAKDCDEAFNRISASGEYGKITPISEAPSSFFDSGVVSRQPSPLIPIEAQLPHKRRKVQHPSPQARPLPPPPARSDSVNIELLRARRDAEWRKITGGEGSPGHLDRMVSHIDRLIRPGFSPVKDRRVISAPVDSKQLDSNGALPSIYETRGEERSPKRPTDLESFMDHQNQSEAKSNRIASAPESRAPARTQIHNPNDRFAGRDPHVRDTIRVVPPSSPSPVKAPAPLTIRKKSSQGGSPPLMGRDPDSGGSHSSGHRPLGLDLRQQYYAGSKVDVSPDLGPIDEDQYLNDQFTNESSTGTVVKKSNWFKRNSKDEEIGKRMSIGKANRLSSQSSSNETTGGQRYDGELPALPKKKGFSFGRLFKKRNLKPDMSVDGTNIYDDDESVQASPRESSRQSQPPHIRGVDDAKARMIEPQQNWLAKLFNVKPTAKFICFSVSKRRARQEVVTILKAWRTYGIRDIQVDKERNIVFGRVGAKNYFNMKEVSFACEIMTVIEHGKRSPLSIARLTQERGAASSFQKVVETLETVLKVRGLLVADERKKRMMVKTLNLST